MPVTGLFSVVLPPALTVRCPRYRKIANPSQNRFFRKNAALDQNDYQYAVIDGQPCGVCTGNDITALKSSLILTQNVLDSLHAIAYIIDRDTYELRFANRALKNHLPDITPGKKCYELLWDRTAPATFVLWLTESGQKPEHRNV